MFNQGPCQYHVIYMSKGSKLVDDTASPLKRKFNGLIKSYRNNTCAFKTNSKQTNKGLQWETAVPTSPIPYTCHKRWLFPF